MVIAHRAEIPEFIPHDARLTVKTCAHNVEATYLSRRNTGATIRKLNKDQYIELSTGEIKDYQHKDNRADNFSEVLRSCRKLRDYINTNVADVSRARWITLTYAENMTDTKRLYADFDKFMKRFRYSLGACEYIVAAEPQGRGAWHMHLLALFPDKAPFIPNKDLSDLWGQGFVKVAALDDIDNIGVYLTAYLVDMELIDLSDYDRERLKKVKSKGKTKRIIKGGRLKLYPTGFNLFRKSKGIKSPTVEVLPALKLYDRIGNALQTYEYAVDLFLEDGTSLTIYKRFYNLKKRAAPPPIKDSGKPYKGEQIRIA